MPDKPVLYELSADPAAALRKIRDEYAPEGDPDRRALRDPLFKDVKQLLTGDDYVRPEVIASITGAYEEAGKDEPEIRGPLGVYLGLNAAVDAARSAEPDAELRAKATLILAEPAMQECFRELYEIKPAYDLANAEIHRIGTTSLILCCPLLRAEPDLPEVVALKCLLPRYHRVRAIRERTKSYKEKHSVKGTIAPRIIESTPLTIAMEFIEGQTLAERFEARLAYKKSLKGTEARKRALHDKDIEFIREVGLEICKCLDELARQGHHHLDLSPSNIIVVSDELDYRLRIKLIDLGQNFAITERVGSSAAYRRAALYVAPELLRDSSKGDWRCDVYSLGVILLEAAAICELRAENLAGELERLWQGERPWEGAPEIARIVDELLDEKPTQRLALANGLKSPGDSYDYLQKLIRQETEVLELYENQTEGSGFGLLRGFGLLKVYRNTQLTNMFQAAKAVEEPVDDAYKDFPALANWAIVAMVCWVVALASFLMLTSADLGLGTVKPWAEWIAEISGRHFQVGEFWENLPGRLVALSFSLTAVTYYVNNFATLSPRRLRVRIGWASEMLMRATSILLVFPILYAMLCNPDAWPLCAGLGTLLVVLNNLVALRIASHAYEVSQRQFTPRGVAGYRFVHDVFKEWWLLLFWYCLALIAIGVLVELDHADDVAIFAIFVIAANVVKMYRTNCVETAPQVRGCLSRAILILRRAAQLPPVEIEAPSDAGIARRRLARFSDWWWAPSERRARRRRRWRGEPRAG